MSRENRSPAGPDLSLETAAWARNGSPRIAGLDEAGRGALAGPVVAAAVILPLENRPLLAELAGVNDSKQLSAPVREVLFERITAHACSYGVGVVEADEIDRIGILPATRRAMQAALERLDPGPAALLIDGRIRLPRVNLPQESIIRGDGRSLTIAAASILAKVTRDRLMIAHDPQHPGYGFAAHKGYGTAAHLAALTRHGPSLLHRRSFAPLRLGLFGEWGTGNGERGTGVGG